MNNLLDGLSIAASFALVFSIVFFIQDWTVGRISTIKDKIVFNRFLLKDLIFSIVAILIICKFFTFNGRPVHRDKKSWLKIEYRESKAVEKAVYTW